MIKIFVITRDSLLFILLVSGTSQALETEVIDPNKQILQQKSVAQKAWDVEKALIDKGLDTEVAKQKSQKLFNSCSTLSYKLTQLASHKELQLSSEMILKQLTEYALYEKPCKLNTYAGMYGFVQKIAPGLNQKQKEALTLLTL